MEENIIDITQLRHDKKNFNKGTDEGKDMMEKSFKEHGAGRSVLLDKDNNIIAGNKSTSAARKAGIKKVRVIETDGTELIAVKRTDISIDSKEGREMALLDNRTAQINLSWDEVELASVQADIEGFDAADFGLDIDIEAEQPSMTDKLRDDMKKRSSWGKAKDYKEPCCDLSDHLQLHKRDCFYYICSYHNTPTGIPISEVKTEPNVELFARKAEEIVRGMVQLRDTKDWCIITTPKRRHKEKNFASMVATQLAKFLGIPFYDDTMEAKGRDRINPDFKQVKDIPESNVILYDDILTTGSTIRACVHLLTDKNVVCVIGIDNNS